MATEKRLIDANGSYTLNEINETGHSLAFGGGFIDVYDPKGKYLCQFWAGDAPTVDAVEVTRCKDCENAKKYCGGLYCKFYEQTMDADDFCSHGERRTDNG